MIKLFVGLGNPGPSYEATRHNAGFWWADALADKLGLNFQPDKTTQSFCAKGTFSGHPVWVLKPQTYMNLSGQAVGALARFFKITPEEILIAHDELDIAPGQVKLKFGGGHAGHNGLRDIHAHLSTPNYWRLRIGVGHPGVKDQVVDWVLKKPSQEHRQLIEAAISHSLQAVPALGEGNMEQATRLIHTKIA